MTSKEKKIQIKIHYLSLKEEDDALFNNRSQKIAFVLKSLKDMLKSAVDILSLQQLIMKWSALIFLMITIFEKGYHGHPAFPYAYIQLEQATKLILSHFQEEDHQFINDTLNNKKKQLVCLYFTYKPKENASRTDIMYVDQKDYSFFPTYGDGSTDFHCHMI